MSPKVLMIAYYFPPIGGAGVQRTVKFVKYLPTSGWEPIVLTVGQGLHITYDRTLMSDMPDTVPVYRSRMFDPEDIRGWWRSRKPAPPEPTDKPSTSDHKSVASTTPSAPPGMLSRLKGALAHLYLRSLPWFCVPDQKVGWLPYATRMGHDICSEHNVSVLFSTSSPITDHLIALRLKRAFGIPWVADFRDLWVKFPGRKPLSPIHGRLEQRIERNIMRHADRIIANTEGARQSLLADYPSIPPDRIVTIPNGYDEADFMDLPAPEADQPFTLTYTGNFYGERSPEPLFKALDQLKASHPDLIRQVRVRLIGPPSPLVDAGIRAYDMDDLVDVEPYQPHRQSIEALASSDVLLLIDGPEFTINIPGKVFEYLRTGRPILALVPQGSTSAVLDETGGAVIVHPKDTDGIADALIRLYDSRTELSSEWTPDPDAVAVYERRRLTGRLAEVFSQVCPSDRQAR